MRNYDLVNVLERRFSIQILSALDQHGAMNIHTLSKTIEGNNKTILNRVNEMEVVGLIYTCRSLNYYQRIVTNTSYGARIIRSLTMAIKEGWNV